MAGMKRLLPLAVIFLAGCGTTTTIVTTGPTGPTGPTGTTACHSANGLPDRSCNPGLASQPTPRCNGTSSVRPPVSYTNALKIKQIKEYGYTDTNPADVEEDHIVPLSLGGDSRSPANLWPQPRSGTDNAAYKDKLEYRLFDLACKGVGFDVPAAQKAIAEDWVTLAQKYGVQP